MQHDEPPTLGRERETFSTALPPEQWTSRAAAKWILKHGSEGHLAVLSQASGVVMARYGIDPIEAVAVIQRLSRERKCPAHEIAREIISTASSGGL
jgi:ANTAR domain